MNLNRQSSQDYDNNNDNDNNDNNGKIVSKGFPEPHGTPISILSANPKVAGEFYAVNNCGIVCSTDLGTLSYIWRYKNTVIV